MPSKTVIGWRNGVVTDVRDLNATGGRHFIKFFVTVDESTTKGGSTFRATALVKPALIPGGDLYKWVRVCNVPLAEIDQSIRPELFRDKLVKVYVVQNGGYFNITDCKTVGG